MSYVRRIVDERLDELCAGLPAVVLRGARGVGKSETAARRANTIYRLDIPQQFAVVEGHPDVLTTGETPILIDEWQKYPASWDLVRRAVDEDTSPNRFLLAGSAAPTEDPLHTGAGRYVFLLMRPMSLAERGLAAPAVSLGDLLAGDASDVLGETEVVLPDYAEEIAGSGFPGIRDRPANLRQELLSGYLEATFSYALSGDGTEVPRHDPDALRRWTQAYAAATATTATYETIRDSATPGEAEKPSESQSLAIRRALADAYIVEPLPAWRPSLNNLRKLGKAPKHHLVDPALAAEALGTDAVALASVDGPRQYISKQRPLVAALFESLVAQSVRVYAEFHRANVHHLRTRDETHEVDLIVVRRDGGVVALEVKLSALPKPRDFRHLSWLKRTIGDRLLDAGIITTGKHAYRHKDTGFAVIPAALLGP